MSSTPHTQSTGETSAKQMRWPLVVLLAAVHAMCFMLAFPPYNLWPLVFISIAPLAMIALRSATPWRHAGLVLLISFAQWLWMCRWSITVTAAGYPGYAFIMALYAPLFVVLVAKVVRGGSIFSRWPAVILVPVIWTGLEFLRGRIAFDGYPWFLIAHPTIEWNAFAQTTAITGTYGLGLIVALINGALTDVLLRGRLPVVGRIASVAASMVVLILPLVLSSARPMPASNLADLNILAIQTNLPQDNKIGWPVEQQRVDLPGFVEQTRAAINEARAGGVDRIDLIVWPETMVPGAGFEPETHALIRRFGPTYSYLYDWADLVRAFAAEVDIPMLVGSPAWVDASLVPEGNQQTLDIGSEYNSAYLITPNGQQQRYDKVFLTPFGETMPYISKSPWLEQKLLALGAGGMQFNLDAADEPRVLELQTTSGPVTIATPICFEDTVPWLVREMVRRSADPARTVIINLSNDGWFGAFDSGREQHAQIARFRCIENRVPMVRVVNTGLSVHVDSVGNLVDQVGESRYGTARQPGWLLAEVRLDGRTTMYARFGDVVGWVALVCLIAIPAAAWATRRRNAPPTQGEDS